MSKPFAILSYGLAVLLFATALVAELLLDRVLNITPSLSLFLCAIMFVAWFEGVGPGLLTTALSILAFDYFFIPPVDSLAVLFKDIPRLTLFAISAVLVVSLSAAQRRMGASLRRARDELEEKVRELAMLNKALRSENDERGRAEQKLRQSEAYLDEAQRLSRTGSFAWKIADDDIVWSKEAYQIMGVDQTVTPSIEVILQCAHPDDRHLVQLGFDHARILADAKDKVAKRLGDDLDRDFPEGGG
jgi:K+-sensing histidine kinase KdpD